MPNRTFGNGHSKFLLHGEAGLTTLLQFGEAEHDDAGALLAQIRELSSGFTPPATCPTYRGLYHSLEEFESDLHRHVHLEDNILFRRAAAMEVKAAEGGGAARRQALSNVAVLIR